LSHPHLAPLIVGTLAILALAVYLTSEMPSPGPLSLAHSGIEDGERLPGCVVCHQSEGLARGCLACHGEIAQQLTDGRGYHAYLLAGEEPHCARCHPDHQGADFELVGELAWDGKGPRGFEHPHVEFGLEGKHEGLGCDDCHDRPAAFAGHVRTRTFLGISQDCVSCHENVHKEERFLQCTGCHNQESFKGASNFQHDKLPLLNGHRGVACGDCHLIDVAARPQDYTRVRGKRCEECHESPHRVDLGADCESCHPRDASPWNVAQPKIDAKLHARTGFPLVRPHDQAECAKCHRADLPYAERFPDPPRPANRCAACHEDVHRGQFAGRGCLECHAPDRWKPALGLVKEHRIFPLRLAHAKVECAKCHLTDPGTGSARFAGRPRTCAGCHDDVHRGQFQQRTCDSCHDERSFKPPLPVVREHRTFPLRLAHADVECAKCHRADPETAVARFAGTARTCAGCHDDVHRGQFGKRACDTCHTERAFLPALYDVERHDSFALTGSHLAVSCRACHEETATGRRFKGTPRSCRECHADVHGGQFAKQTRKGDCTACHLADASTFAVRPFDHAARTKYPLEGAHAKALCARCHVERAVRGAPAPVRVYRGTPTACASCHTDVHRGQFRDARCDTCHLTRDEWTARGFDHAKTRFPLDRAHAPVACDRCHPTVRQPDGSSAVQYRPLPTECQSCHAFKQK